MTEHRKGAYRPMRRAKDLGLEPGIGFGYLGDSEVRYQRAPTSVFQQYVVGLHIPMNDSLCVSVREGPCNLAQDAHRLGRRQRAVSAHPLAQGESFDIRHHEEHVLA